MASRLVLLDGQCVLLPERRERAGPDNTGHRIDGLTNTAQAAVLAGQSHVGKRFTQLVNMSGGTVTDCEFAGGLIVVPGTPATVTWSTVRGGLGLASCQGGRFSHLDIRDTAQDTLHVTTDRGPTAGDLVLDTCWMHGFQPAAGAHADGVQLRGVDGLALLNCTVDLGPWQLGPDGKDALNAAFFIEEANGGNANVRLKNCYFNGGGITYRASGDVAGLFEIVGCDFGPDWHYGLQLPTKDRLGSLPTRATGNRYLTAEGVWLPLTFL